RSG
ncbi:hypothetical protein DMN91_008519, partial [Ooceraea biroi]